MSETVHLVSNGLVESGMLTRPCQTLHYGSRSHLITPPPDDVPYQLYLTKPFESTRKADKLPHAGSLFEKPGPSAVDQRMKSTKAVLKADPKQKMTSSSSKSSTSSGLDSDIEALQNGLAAHDAARDR